MGPTSWLLDQNRPGGGRVGAEGPPLLPDRPPFSPTKVFASLPFPYLSFSFFSICSCCLRPDPSFFSVKYQGNFRKKEEKKVRKRKESRKKEKTSGVFMGTMGAWACLQGASRKMNLWERPLVPNSWAAASLSWLLLYHFPCKEADQDKSAFLPLCLGPALSLCQLLVCWGSWVWENPPGSSMFVCSSTYADGVSSGSHGSRDTTNKSNHWLPRVNSEVLLRFPALFME